MPGLEYTARSNRRSKTSSPQLQELKGDLAGFRGEMAGELTGVRAEIAGVRAEVAGVRAEMRELEKPMEDGFTLIRSAMTVRFAALDEKFTQRLDHTDKRRHETLEIRARLAALEASCPLSELGFLVSHNFFAVSRRGEFRLWICR